MDIGDYIVQQRDKLEGWGHYVSETLSRNLGSHLKIPCEERVKLPASARAKQIKKQYPDPIRQMTDLVGTRCVVLTRPEISSVMAWVESHQAWEARKSRDFEEEVAQNPKIFDYQSCHYEIRPKGHIDLPIGRVSDEFCCELQVRTLLQHAYAEMVHDNVYKPLGDVPSQAERLIARSMALMETTDDMFDRAIQEIGKANAPVDQVIEACLRLTGESASGPGKGLARFLLASYRSLLDESAGRSLSNFVEQHEYILERIQERGYGLFEFKAASLAGYWLAHQLERDVLDDWPLPATYRDAQQILSDLGIAAE